VPLRRVLLNQDGTALAIVLLAIVVVALVSGLFFEVKGGFCNSICPVLPVEKLYGQSPLISVRNPRCVPCAHCTSSGCIDIDPGLSVRQALGKSPSVSGWLKTPFGVFVAAFPGFILGYFKVEDVAFSQIVPVYGLILTYALASFVIVVLVSVLLKVGYDTIAPVSGVLCIGTYYWFAAPASFDAFGLPGGDVAKWILLVVIAFWFTRALSSASNNGGKGGSSKHFDEPMKAVSVRPVIH